ncbi:MAG: bifunctional oligoribonuclease/PAP phosphatase NrnA [Planctomycetota bacterium]|nr:bifunctional oligoribonuclease/PAP phosphatase NrnA [Planctomycetota bacterium]
MREIPREIADFLRAKPSLVITAHEQPDGDAVGAVLGLRRILADAGFSAVAMGLQPMPPRYRFLVADGEIRSPGPGWWQGAQALMALDCGAFDRLPDFAQEARGRILIVNIDHHDANHRFGDLNWVDGRASSAGEMVYRLARSLGYAVSSAAAAALWTAIVTDTGQFSYANTSAEVLRLAADLLEKGVDTAAIHRQVYQSFSLAEMRLTERALASLKLHEAGRVATVCLAREDFAACGCGPENVQEIVNIARSVAGVEVGIFFYEPTDEAATKVSVRTVPPLNACDLCRRFGGGGHQRAAGCTVAGRIPEVLPTVLAEVKKMWYNTPLPAET